jgi:adenylylsulfate kinase
MTTQKATHITWHAPTITRGDREKLFRHKGAVLWFTGLSASGKSTAAHAAEAMLFERGCRTYVLDGDNIRHGLNKDLGFSAEDRHENIRRIGEVARLFADCGVIVMTAFISPYVKDRRMARNLNPPGDFIEIYCECPLRACEDRDPKGLYKKARAGEIKHFTGIDDPYEPPQEPELVLHTDRETVRESARKVIRHLENKGFLAKRR